MGILVPNQNAGKSAINDFNLQIRQQPWYQQWFASQGLNPNHVKLSRPQREQLKQVIIQHGAPPDAFQDMDIDPAGNLNSEHGFHSLPTWAKIVTAAAPVVAAHFVPGLGPLVDSALTLGGSTAGVGATAAGTAGTAAGAAGTAAGVAGVTAPAIVAGAGGGSFLTGATLASLAGTGASAVTGILGNRSAAHANEAATNAQLTASQQAAELEAKANADQLSFLKEQEAARKAEWEKTQALNLDQYNQALARLAPYRGIGLAGLANIGKASFAPAPGYVPGRMTGA